MKSSKLQGSIFKIKIMAFAGILLLIWCGYRLIKTGLEEQQDYEFLAVSEEQEIPQEFLEELAERRGVTVVSAVLDVPFRDRGIPDGGDSRSRGYGDVSASH